MHVFCMFKNIFFSTLQLIFKKLFSGKSESDSCTLYSDHNLINRKNVKSDPHTAYRADQDLPAHHPQVKNDCCCNVSTGVYGQRKPTNQVSSSCRHCQVIQSEKIRVFKQSCLINRGQICVE